MILLNLESTEVLKVLQKQPVPYIHPYAMRARISREQPHGLAVINMALNELPFPPSDVVAQVIANRCENANRYGTPQCDELQREISRQFNVQPDSIICGNGSEELLDVIARNFVQAGDDILISEFGYIQFALIANRLNATLVKATESDYTADVESLIAAITAKTKLIFLANPNNPTGTCLSTEQVQYLANKIPESVLLVLDLAYGEFVGDDYCRQMHELVQERNNVVVTRTFSKAYGLAGLRVGWCHAPAWMIPGFYAARGMGSVNGVAQAAAVAALDDMDTIYERIAYILTERERVVSSLVELGVYCVPSSANFVLMTFVNKEIAAAEAFVEYLFDRTGILTTYTREAGLEGFFRISLSWQEHNDLLIEAVRNFSYPE